jgi:hypothetical protein
MHRFTLTKTSYLLVNGELHDIDDIGNNIYGVFKTDGELVVSGGFGEELNVVNVGALVVAEAVLVLALRDLLAVFFNVKRPSGNTYEAVHVVRVNSRTPILRR